MPIGINTSTITTAGINKLVMGFVVFAATALMGASVIAGATPVTAAGDPVPAPTSKEQCKHGGWASFKDAHGQQSFQNQGQCVSWVETHSHGYGGGGNGGGIGNIIDLINAIAHAITSILGSIGNILGNIFHFF